MPGVKGRSGGRQKSAKQRALDGSRRRKHHHRQPTPVEGEPTPPEWLTDDERDWWDHFAALLRGRQQLTVDAGPWLLNAATVTEQAMRWRAEAAGAPLIVASESGERAHPAHVQARLAWREYQRTLTEAGLTPASVSRVALPKTDDEDVDEFAAFQARGQIRRVK